MSALPSQRWVSSNGINHIYQYPLNTDKPCSIEETCLASTTDNPFELIKAASKILIAKEAANNSAEKHSLPFTGGLVSYFSYDLGRQQLDIQQRSEQQCQLPDMVTGLYNWAIVQDHELQQCYLTSLSDCPPALINFIRDRIASYQDYQEPTPLSIETLYSNTPYSDYCEKLQRIHQYIHAGDCYQVNFSQCFSATYQGDPYTAYRHLRDKMASPFSAFIDLGHNQAILSLSPERLLQTQDRDVLTQPIKGTISRDHNRDIDERNAQALLASTKNCAENLMIVDLLRNDLGKNCKTGSINVPQLFNLESYPNVHHLVSSITGTMTSETSSLDVFEGCFPGGSITGAPKKRAMEIIEELEESQRSVYCGSIAYINAKGDMDSNITIRTVACDGEKIYCWGGGGIVADSEVSDEYQESLTKINTILEGLALFSNK
jgi:para-aminobenzoate synthetase component 1